MKFGPLVPVDGRRDKTPTQDRSTVMLARSSCFSSSCCLPVPVQFGPCALVGERPLSWGYVPRASRYTGIVSPPSTSSYYQAGLASCQHILDEDRTLTHCLLRSDYTYSSPEVGD